MANMKEYISKEYINNLLTRHLDNWWGPEYYACSIIQDDINDAPETEILRIGIDLTEDLNGRN
jgi:hypothetical protein